MVKSVKENGGTVRIFSSLHISGECKDKCIGSEPQSLSYVPLSPFKCGALGSSLIILGPHPSSYNDIVMIVFFEATLENLVHDNYTAHRTRSGVSGKYLRFSLPEPEDSDASDQDDDS